MTPQASQTLVETSLPLPLFARGKVRDIYDLGESLLFVATDRISAFDCVLPTPIPDKGWVLTGLSGYWFVETRSIVDNHFITMNLVEVPEVRAFAASLAGRAMVVRKAKRIDVECVVRGYLAGSGWKEYRRDGTVCGIALPPGLKEGDPLPAPIFTPATKADSGHDENISPAKMAGLVGADLGRRLAEISIALYIYAAGHMRSRGLLLADTKFEFGLDSAGQIILIDEVLTPDSSRFWDAEEYRQRGPATSFDKQLVRDYLETIGWDKQPPAPALPPEIVAATRARYLEAYRRITGAELA